MQKRARPETTAYRDFDLLDDEDPADEDYHENSIGSFESINSSRDPRPRKRRRRTQETDYQEPIPVDSEIIHGQQQPGGFKITVKLPGPPRTPTPAVYFIVV